MDIVFKSDQRTDSDSSSTFWWGLMENLPCAIFVLAEDGACLYINPAARRLLGYETDELTLKDMADVGELIMARELSDGTGALGEEAAFESSLDRVDGRRLPVDLTFRTFEHDGVAGRIVFARDASERKKSQKVRRSYRLQQDAIASMGQTGVRNSDARHLMAEACRLVKGALELQCCGVFELQGDQKTFVLVAGSGWEGECIGRSVVDGEFFGSVGPLQHSDKVPVCQFRADARAPAFLLEQGVVDGLVSLAETHGRRYALLGARTASVEPLGPGAMRFLQSITRIMVDSLRRREVEAALKRETLFNENLLRTADIIILVLDRDGRIVRFNRFMEDLGGYSLSEAFGRSWFETFIPSRDRARVRTYFSAAVQGAETRGNVNPIVTKDGSEHLIEWYNKALEEPTGNTVGVLCIGLDITTRRRVENWMESLVETTQDAVISIDRQGRVVLFNPSAERIFGYERQEIRGENLARLMPEPYASEHNGYVERYERTGERRAIGRIRTVEAMRKDGTVFPIELSVTEIPLDEEVHYAAFIRDISEKTKLEQLLVEKERLAVVGATAAGFVHEIGNPLNAMSMTAQLLERRLAKDRDLLDESVYTQVRNLREELRRLNELLQEFRSLARQESYDLRPTSLTELCGEVFALHAQAYRQQGVEVTRSFPDGLPLVRADRDKLKQALINLCNNALEAMPHGGTLQVRASALGGEVTLEVRDSGTGVKKEIDVFEPFATTKPKGTGLGLMITRKIVAAHGGTITYDSEAGKGTTFRITLPESTAAEPS